MKKILFVGSSGAVAEKVIPELSKVYDVVGVSRSRNTMKNFCVDFYKINLLQGYQTFFDLLFQKHTFDVIIWNPVMYFPALLSKTSRAILHTEFDIAIALALECFKSAYVNGFSGQKTFIFSSSQLAFGVKERWGSYSIVKQAQIKLAEYLSNEYDFNDVNFKIIAFGSVPNTDDSIMLQAFISSIEDKKPGSLVVKVDSKPSLL